MTQNGSYYFTVQAITDGTVYKSSDPVRSPDQAIGGVYAADGFAASDFPAETPVSITLNGGPTSHAGTAQDPHALSYFNGDYLTIAVTGSPTAVYWTVNGASVGTAGSTTYTFRAGDWNKGTYTITVHATIGGTEYSAITVAEVDL